MSRLIDAQSAVVAAIKRVLPALKTCEAHPGRFTLEELKAFAAKAPSAHVAMPNVRSIRRQGDAIMVEVKFVGVVTARDTVVESVGLSRDEAVVNMITALIAELPRGTFGLGISAPSDLRCDNLYDSGDRSKGVAMWAIHWTSTVQWLADTDDGILPSALYFGIAPNIGEEHINDYTEIVIDGAVQGAGL